MQNVYLWCRKIHRITLFSTVVLGVFMMTTGLMMKFGVALPFLDLGAARDLHNMVSIFFAITLGIQMISGVYMYIHPYVLHWQARRFPKRF